MRELPVRARLLVSAVFFAAFACVSYALVMVAGGSAGPENGGSVAGRLTVVELVVVALVTVFARALLLTPTGRRVQRRYWLAAGVLVVSGFGLVVFLEREYSRDYLAADPGLVRIPIVFLMILAIVTLLAASYSSFTAGEGGFTVDQVLPVLIASFLIAGTWSAVVVAASLALIPPPGVEPVKSLYNSAVRVLFVWAGGSIFVLIAGALQTSGNGSVLDSWWNLSSSRGGATGFVSLVLAVLVANVVSVAVNVALIGAVVSFAGGTSLVKTTLEIARVAGGLLVLNSVIGLILAIVYLHSGVGVLAMVLVLLPLFAARWVFVQIAGERSAQEATLAALIKAVETKDWYTKGHSERVAVGALQIGASLKLDPDLMRELRFAGMLHDVGKLGVPTGVLIKPGRLDDAEFDAIKRHPVLGQEVVRGIEFLEEAKRGIYYHHERMDGLGYPEGLKGEDIPLFARILGVADAFDSMTQVRSYRGARSVEAAVEELNRHRDTQFDSRMVDALVAALDSGWKPEAPPVLDWIPEPNVEPALGVDDDDPSAAAALAAHRPQVPQRVEQQ